MISKIHKAISIIQFKSERQIIKIHPEFEMEDRIILDDLSPDFKEVTLYEKTYEMLDSNFPTFEHGFELTEEEKFVMEKFDKKKIIDEIIKII